MHSINKLNKIKKMKTKIVMIAIATMSIMLTSCNSDDDNNCIPNYTGELLAAEEKLVGKWVLTSMVAEDEVDLTDDDTENPSTNLFAQYSACEKDLFYTFTDARVMKFMVGTTATDCENETESTSSWKLDGNRLYFVNTCLEFYIDVAFAGDDSAFSIDSDVVITDVEGEKITTTITYVYTKEVAL